MSAVSNADIIASYESAILSNRAAYAAAALVCFEHLITLKYEIDFLWRRKWSATTWIFILNRYLLLANVVSIVIPIGPKICDQPRVVNALNYFTTAGFYPLPTDAFTILRTFALVKAHSWRFAVTGVLIALALTTIALATFEDFKLTWIYIEDPILGSFCSQTGFSIPPTTITRMHKAASIITISSASLVLVVTLMKTARLVQQASKFGFKNTLSHVLLRDGSLFFLIVLLQNIYFAVIAGSLLNVAVNYIMITLLSVLPPLLLSPFIINLRQTDSPDTDAFVGQPTARFSMPRFRRPTLDEIVGNIGEPLDFAEHSLYDAEDADTDEADRICTSGETGVTDIEAADPCGCDVAGRDVRILDIGGAEFEAC